MTRLVKSLRSPKRYAFDIFIAKYVEYKGKVALEISFLPCNIAHMCFIWLTWDEMWLSKTPIFSYIYLIIPDVALIFREL